MTDAATHTDNALLRDPLDEALAAAVGEEPDAMEQGDADDLIAAMADDAIDRMLGSNSEEAVEIPAADSDLDALLRGDMDAPANEAAAAVGAELDLEPDPLAFDPDDADDPLAGVPDLVELPITADVAMEEQPATQEQALPMWAMPLAWMNQPFSRLSDNGRQAVGKVALVTLANAAGVLLFIAIRG